MVRNWRARTPPGFIFAAKFPQVIMHDWMPPISQLVDKLDVVTAGFSYVRWLGDRHGIEEKNQHCYRIIVNREAGIRIWIPVIC